jgi:hypothetical protein
LEEHQSRPECSHPNKPSSLPKMANFDDLPDYFDRRTPNALWVPRHNPPPPHFFPTVGHLETKDAINAFYINQGFATTVNNCNYHKPSGIDPGKYVVSFTLRCACGRSYKQQSTGKRKRTASRMTGCQWAARCKKGRDEETGDFGWSFVVEVPHHNHNRSIGRSAFSQNRKRDEYLLRCIKAMYLQHDSASKMLNTLIAENNRVTVRLSDVRNEIQKLRRVELAGQTPIESLLHFLETFKNDDGGDEVKYFVRVQYDNDNQVKNLFFAHPDCFKIIKENPDCIQIDATYKVNKFNMPLLHIVGVTCHHTVYDISFGFMGGEDHAHYAWHMNAMYELFEELSVTPKCFVTDHDKALKAALTAIYPDVVQRRCIWHINQSVLKAAHKAYDLKKANGNEKKMKELDEGRNDFMARWHELVSRPTQKMFWESYEAIQEDYSDQPTLLLYIDDEQMEHFEEWAECFCRHFPDYGIRVTSRVEGSHYRIKACLAFQGQSHLLHVVKDIHTLMRKQRHEYEAKSAAASVSVPADAADAEFDLLKRIISPFALRQLKQQLKLAKADDYNNGEACTGAFTDKFGLPCKHFLHDRVQQARAAQDDPKAIYYVKPNHVDQHWYLDPPRARGETVDADEVTFRPLDPLKIKSKGRPHGATTKSIPKSKKGKKAAPERRDLSGWEHSQAEQDGVRTAASQASQAPPKKRTVKRKVIEKVTEEEIEEDAPPAGATMTQIQDLLATAMGPLQQQIAALQSRLQKEIHEISDDESADEEEEEDRDSDDDFPIPEQPKAVENVEDTDKEDEKVVVSNYGLRSKTPHAKQSGVRGGRGEGG